VHLSRAEANGRSELNVIGQTTDEAVDAVDKFLDEASLASLSQVRIVHGHGTGALRRAIGDFLKGHPHVARFVNAPPDQGGAGATLVELRQ
jgi:DNA mismatch repair protein MutS2